MSSQSIEKTSKNLGLIAAFVLTILIISSMFLLTIDIGLEQALLGASALTALYVLILPVFLMKTYDIFQPLTFTILAVLIGVSARVLYLLLYPNADIFFLLRGESGTFLIPAVIVIIIGLTFFVIGYLQVPGGLSLKRIGIARSGDWHSRRLFLAVLIFSIISIFSTVILLRETGFVFGDIADLSSKRYFDTEGGRSSLGYLRWASDLSQTAFLLIIAWFARASKKWFSFSGLAVFIVFLIAAIPPFTTSSRGGLLWLVLSSVIIWHYLRNRISLKSLAIVGVIALLILSFMLTLRRSSRALDAGILDDLIGSRDMLDVSTTAFIIDFVQEDNSRYKYGSTYITWLYAPIPRTLWSEKPIISIGWEVREKIFGFRGDGGIPPNIIGEAYWNFGIIGVIIILWLHGIITKLLYKTFQPYLNWNRNMVVIYAAVIAPWSLAVMGGGWSNVLIMAIKSFVPLTIVLIFITRRIKN